MIRQRTRRPSRPPDSDRRHGEPHGRFRGRPDVRTLGHPPALILGAGALWTSVAAPHDPIVMWPIAAWLWLTTLFTIHRAAKMARATRIN